MQFSEIKWALVTTRQLKKSTMRNPSLNVRNLIAKSLLFGLFISIIQSCDGGASQEVSTVENPNEVEVKPSTSQDQEPEITRKLTFNFPENWDREGHSFVDTSGEKVGELLPGLVTAKGKVITGKAFLQSFVDTSILEFQETDFTSMGMPFDLLEMDSVDLENGRWYYALSDYGQDDGIFQFGFTYYTVVDSQSVILNFYHDTLSEALTQKHHSLLGSMAVEMEKEIH